MNCYHGNDANTCPFKHPEAEILSNFRVLGRGPTKQEIDVLIDEMEAELDKRTKALRKSGWRSALIADGIRYVAIVTISYLQWHTVAPGIFLIYLMMSIEGKWPKWPGGTSNG